MMRVKTESWAARMGKSAIVCARMTAEGRYMENALCLARIARPSKAAVVSASEMSEGTATTSQRVRSQSNERARELTE